MSEENLNENKIKQALDYHQNGKPGKIEVRSTKPCLTARDLSLAYTPGVAHPCLKIHENPEDAYKYTSKGNLVAVLSNGSAVLGLGNIGALAGKPVMEGKGILFKRFADIDVFDIEINEPTVEGMVKVVEALEPTFGGINLEDIKAPECFEVERILKEKLNIPVFHDDQHGTAIIASAGFLNALEVTGRKIDQTTVVFSGAGAAAIATARLFVDLGVKKENIIMCDSKGVVYSGRTDGMNQYKEEFAISTDKRTIADAMTGADAFVGCSSKGVINQDMIKTMAKNPIVFAMANPDPEIYPHEVLEVRPDAIVATGRSDYPNQINNVLGFPYIFRGALDVRATAINQEMKIAAVKALASLAKEEVTDEVRDAYNHENFKFGKNYLIPKPFDSRVLSRVTPAVAKAAIDSGVARLHIEDMISYTMDLEQRLGHSMSFARRLRDLLDAKAARLGRKIRLVLAEGANSRILQACNILSEEGHLDLILIGSPKRIHDKMKELGLEHLKDKIKIIKPSQSPLFPAFKDEYFAMRQRYGISDGQAWDQMKMPGYFGAMMVKNDHADALLSGPTRTYAKCLGPITQILKTDEKVKLSGIGVLVFNNKVIFFGDSAVQVEPNSEDLADIAHSASVIYKKILPKKEPSIAFLSFSNFGGNPHPGARKIKTAVDICKKKYPHLKVDGEMQADVAINRNISERLYAFSELDRSADVLIFPELNSANISFKLLTQLAEADALGPVLTPLKYSANIVPRTYTVSEIVNLAILTAVL